MCCSNPQPWPQYYSRSHPDMLRLSLSMLLALDLPFPAPQSVWARKVNQDATLLGHRNICKHLQANITERYTERSSAGIENCLYQLGKCTNVQAVHTRASLCSAFDWL
eukprot:6184579-Pleurochrysis_carterae.AAC.3